jgi:UDPglucose--hexose-1-phosphate uridylyltransferase
MFDSPHRRFNPLTGEWVLVSPHRAKRPWLGQVEKTPPENLLEYDSTCYLCPRNQRAGGFKNPDYQHTFVFDNDFSALLTDEVQASASDHPLLASVPERGLCRVVCFSPRHDLTLPELELSAIENVIRTWGNQSAEIGSKDFIQYVQVFENKGAMMGCSNPHPHSQVWGTEHIPNEPAKELKRQKKYFDENNSTLLSNYLKEEHKRKERIIFANDHFTALVPYWAVWPFEMMIIAHGAAVYLNELNSDEVTALAEVMKCVSDITPETAAERLQSLSDIHYRHP